MEKASKRVKRPKDWTPNKVFPAGHARGGLPQCRYWSSGQGRQCGNSPAKGDIYCEPHLKQVHRGKKSGQYKHGRYAQVARNLPDDMAHFFLESMKDPHQMELHTSVGLLVAGRDRLLAQLAGQGRPASWQMLDQVFSKLDQAGDVTRNPASTDEQKTRAAGHFNEALDELRTTITQGVASGFDQTFKELRGVIHQHDRTVALHQANEIRREKTYTERDIATILGFYTSVVKAIVAGSPYEERIHDGLKKALPYPAALQSPGPPTAKA